MQLLSGHSVLNYFLQKIGKLISPLCECRIGDEDTHHFLFHCPLFETHRQQMRLVVSESNLLWPPPLSEIPGSLALWNSLLVFIKSTRRLVRRVVTPSAEVRPPSLVHNITALWQWVRFTGPQSAVGSLPCSWSSDDSWSVLLVLVCPGRWGVVGPTGLVSRRIGSLVLHRSCKYVRIYSFTFVCPLLALSYGWF